MAAPKWVSDLLEGGLPQVLDFGDQATAPNDPKPEQTPPADVVDRENANPMVRAFNSAVSGEVVMLAAIGVAGFLLFRALK